jgi:hypothetical protein
LFLCIRTSRQRLNCKKEQPLTLKVTDKVQRSRLVRKRRAPKRGSYSKMRKVSEALKEIIQSRCVGDTRGLEKARASVPVEQCFVPNISTKRIDTPVP